MWLGFWHKFGVGIDFFFGRYDIIADVINIPDKEALYCYIARFIYLLKKAAFFIGSISSVLNGHLAFGPLH